MRFRKNFLVKSFALILLSVVMFALSSKSKEPKGGFGGGSGSACDNISQANFTVNIAFDPASTANGYPSRNDFYEFYIPQNDIRNGYSSPASDLTNGSSYYCLVTVTSPQCPSFSWSGRVTSSNGADGSMTIKVPDKAVETRIKVEYYEACANGVWAPNNTRLKYVREKNFLSSPVGFPSETFFLIPAGTNTCSGTGSSNKNIDTLLDEFEAEQ